MNVSPIRCSPALTLVTSAEIIKYLGFRNSTAAIFAGSCVNVAEKRSFWHEISGCL